MNARPAKRRPLQGGAFVLAAIGCAVNTAASAAAQATSEFERCARIDDDRERLACYDASARRSAPGPAGREAGAGLPAAAEPPQPGASGPAVGSQPPGAGLGLRHRPDEYLEDVWSLAPQSREDRPGFGAVQPYRPIWALIGRWTSAVNRQPASPAPGHAVSDPLPWQSVEGRFQLSMKSQLLGDTFAGERLGFGGWRLWFAYTQQSSWQLYNASQSRPFRETDYEPELILTLPRQDRSGPWKLLNVGLVHQSNGRSNPESRSWNRAYLQGGWETGGLAVLARVWWRFPESAANDDNPDITDYVGRGEIVARWGLGDWIAGLTLRHTLKFNPSRGYVQLDLFSPPLDPLGHTRAYLQFTSGYGDSLIDYNFRQNTVGIGLSFGDRW